MCVQTVRRMHGELSNRGVEINLGRCLGYFYLICIVPGALFHFNSDLVEFPPALRDKVPLHTATGCDVLHQFRNIEVCADNMMLHARGQKVRNQPPLEIYLWVYS
jgi:hypothetical protein